MTSIQRGLPQVGLCFRGDLHPGGLGRPPPELGKQRILLECFLCVVTSLTKASDIIRIMHGMTSSTMCNKNCCTCIVTTDRSISFEDHWNKNIREYPGKCYLYLYVHFNHFPLYVCVKFQNKYFGHTINLSDFQNFFFTNLRISDLGVIKNYRILVY